MFKQQPCQFQFLQDNFQICVVMATW